MVWDRIVLLKISIYISLPPVSFIFFSMNQSVKVRVDVTHWLIELHHGDQILVWHDWSTGSGWNSNGVIGMTEKILLRLEHLLIFLIATLKRRLICIRVILWAWAICRSSFKWIRKAIPVVGVYLDSLESVCVINSKSVRNVRTYPSLSLLLYPIISLLLFGS
jgi:hypothetical protein